MGFNIHTIIWKFGLGRTVIVHNLICQNEMLLICLQMRITTVCQFNDHWVFTSFAISKVACVSRSLRVSCDEPEKFYVQEAGIGFDYYKCSTMAFSFLVHVIVLLSFSPNTLQSQMKR